MIWLSIILVGGGIIYLMIPDAGSKKNSRQTTHPASINKSESETLESGDIVREQLPSLEEKALAILKEKGLSDADKTLALVALRNIGKVNYDPRVYKKTLLKLIDE